MEPSHRLNALDVLRLVSVPDEPLVYALPTKDRPGRIISQQRRALTIAHSMILEWRRGRLWRRDHPFRLAVIGAGFGGIAAALHAASHGATVTIFEKEIEPLHRFRKSHRVVDPTLGDWPEESWVRPDAGLRAYNWKIGREVSALAEETCKHLQFASMISQLDVRSCATIFAEPASRGGRIRKLAVFQNHKWDSEQDFEAILCATGFGPEQCIPGGTSQCYWDGVTLPPEVKSVIIIGNGDGGLTELASLLGVPDDQHRWLLNNVDRALENDTQYRAWLLECRKRESAYRFDRAIRPGLDASQEITNFYTRDAEHWRRALRLKTTVRTTPLIVDIVGTSEDLLRIDTFPVNRFIVAALLTRDASPLNKDSTVASQWHAQSTSHVLVRYHNARVAWQKPQQRKQCVRIITYKGARQDLVADVVVACAGPTFGNDEWAIRLKRAEEHRGEVRDLNLLERNVPAGVLTSSSDWSSNWKKWPYERFASEFYDSYIQAIAWHACGQRLRQYLSVYTGKLRLDILLFNKLCLSDAAILDGVFFHKALLHAETWQSIKRLIEKERLQMSSRDDTVQGALARFLLPENRLPPEPSAWLSFGKGNDRRNKQRMLDEWANDPPVRPNGWDWQDCLRKWQWPAWSVIPRYVKLGKQLSDIPLRIQRWRDEAALLPTFNGAEILSGLPSRTFSQLSAATKAIRENRGRSRVFSEIRRRFSNKDPIIERVSGPVDTFVSWYNSSYYHGIFARDQVLAAEFLWLPPAERSLNTRRSHQRSIKVCLQCLGNQPDGKFEDACRELSNTDAEERLFHLSAILTGGTLDCSRCGHEVPSHTGGSVQSSLSTTFPYFCGPLELLTHGSGFRCLSAGTDKVLTRVEWIGD